MQVISSLRFLQFTDLIHNLLVIQSNRDKGRRRAYMKQELELQKIIHIETQFCHFLRHIFETKNIMGKSISFSS